MARRMSLRVNYLELPAAQRRLAEGVGFEPTEVISFAGFQDRCIQPLCHPSGMHRSKKFSDSI